MLFNSFEFIFVFLPFTFVMYFFLNKQKFVIASKAWLVVASLIFYSYWNIKNLPLILLSIIFNFSIGSILSSFADNNKPIKKNLIHPKTILIFAISTNLLLLIYFKYTNFLIQNVNFITGDHFSHLNIILPLGISFFTFTQIAYLVDAYKGEVKEIDYLNYSLFVTFFPHLIAGPILHHKEMMPQFDKLKNKILNYKNISSGIFLFSIGLFKKIIIADTFAIMANIGYTNFAQLKMVDAWITSFAYTFQLYFDFSGYTDMALGIALLFNIFLPINFNSPYKALDIQDFWRRWHITLSRFLRDYIYIPLGGNRISEFVTYRNLFITFLIGGVWHGANWTFVIWGAMHGIALIINKYWKQLNIKLNKSLCWLLTFNFVNLAWVFFRAPHLNTAISIIKSMLGFNGIISLYQFMGKKYSFLTHYGISFDGLLSVFRDTYSNPYVIFALIITGFILITLKNSNELTAKFKPSYLNFILTITLLLWSMFNIGKVSEFLYFQF